MVEAEVALPLGLCDQAACLCQHERGHLTWVQTLKGQTQNLVAVVDQRASVWKPWESLTHQRLLIGQSEEGSWDPWE